MPVRKAFEQQLNGVHLSPARAPLQSSRRALAFLACPCPCIAQDVEHQVPVQMLHIDSPIPSHGTKGVGLCVRATRRRCFQGTKSSGVSHSVSLSARQEIRMGLARANIKLPVPPSGPWASHTHGPLIGPGVACSSFVAPALSNAKNDTIATTRNFLHPCYLISSPFPRAPVPRPRCPVLNSCETARTSTSNYY